MESQLCLWCGVKVVLVVSIAGQAIAVQCPLCLDSAPIGQRVGREPPKPKAPTREERKELQKAKATKAARQLDLFGK